MTADEMVRIFSHPLRPRILKLTATETLSPSAIADLTDYSLGVVAYHVRQLVMAGALMLVRETPVRGSLQHFYKATPLGVRAAAALDVALAEVAE